MRQVYIHQNSIWRRKNLDLCYALQNVWANLYCKQNCWITICTMFYLNLYHVYGGKKIRWEQTVKMLLTFIFFSFKILHNKIIYWWRKNLDFAILFKKCELFFWSKNMLYCWKTICTMFYLHLYHVGLYGDKNLI